MDFDNNNESLYSPVSNNDSAVKAPRKKKHPILMIFFSILFIFSILANFFLIILLVVVSMTISSTHSDSFVENVIREGSSSSKIAVIRIQGVIENELCEQVRLQLKDAKKDHNVKAVIIRVISPGGGVSASDRIHHYIGKFKSETGKPVVSFMQTVAASGGYYVSVACDSIISEPTTITGSIGVMANYMVLKQLLEEKLGITPVTLKSGEKKDWPSMFSEATEEQKQYLMDKAIMPAYDRFIQLVADGREELTLDQVKELSDGSIYGAPEARDKKLIDQVGFMEDAIALTENLAGIKDAKVIEYEKPFTFSSMLTSKSGALLNIDRNMLEKFVAPQIMYLWDGR
jgi:protease IV